MTTTCGACGASEQTGAFCAVCGTPTVATSRRGDLSPQLAMTTEPEMRESTRRASAQMLRAASDAATAAPPTAPLAGVGRRAGAYVLDLLAVSLVAGAVGLVVALTTGVFDAMAAVGEASTAMGASAAASEAFAALGTVYGAMGLVSLLGWVGLGLADGLTGRTLGNRLLGIRTDAADPALGTDAPVGAGRGLLRWLVLALCGVLPLIGTVLVLVSPTFDSSGRRQGWHDKAARSVVRDVRGAPPRSFAPASGGVRPAAPEEGSAAAAAGSGSPAVEDPWSFPAAERGTGGIITGVPGAPGTGAAPADARPADAAVESHTVHRVAGAPGAQPTPAVDPTVDPAVDQGAPTVPVAQQPPVQPAPVQPAPVQPAPVQQAPVPPVAPVQPAAAPAAESPAEAEDFEDIEATRFSVSSRRAAGDGSAPPRIVVEVDPGRRVTVASRMLVGRNPQQDAGAPAMPLRLEDTTRSVSKTHLELLPESDGLRVTDLGSTNGSAVIAPDGTVHELVAGTPARVTAGWTVQAGARRLLVVGPDGA